MDAKEIKVKSRKWALCEAVSEDAHMPLCLRSMKGGKYLNLSWCEVFFNKKSLTNLFLKSSLLKKLNPSLNPSSNWFEAQLSVNKPCWLTCPIKCVPSCLPVHHKGLCFKPTILTLKRHC